MRTQIAAANWKMNLTLEKAEALLDGLLSKPLDVGAQQRVVFAVPAPYLYLAQQKVSAAKHVSVAAQNVHQKLNGAYTGEISIEMLQSFKVQYVLVGHSERRELCHEDNSLLHEKIALCIEHNIKPIFCCGEALEVREAGSQNDFISTQLSESLFSLTADQVQQVVIAYEPIWAIGTGKTATVEQVQEMHSFIRTQLSEKYNDEIAQNISILYGGSVKADNAAEIFALPDVDGGLVGGASLKADDFRIIIESLKP